METGSLGFYVLIAAAVVGGILIVIMLLSQTGREKAVELGVRLTMALVAYLERWLGGEAQVKARGRVMESRARSARR